MMEEKGECPQGRSQIYKGCQDGGGLSKCICVHSRSMGGAMMGMRCLGAKEYMGAFECGDNGVDCFVVSINMEINKIRG